MTGTLHVTAHGPHVALLEIDNAPVNALDHGMFRTFVEVLDRAEKDPDLRCIVITGRGRAFCSGEDLNDLAASGEGLGTFGDMLDRVEACRVPVIAAVNGFAIGGGFELALCCDIRIGSEQASFACAGVNVGLIGGVYRLPRLIGPGRAKELQFTGARFDAATCERYGLLNSVHAADALVPAALAMAERIATRAPMAVAAAKRMIGKVYLPPEANQAAFDAEMAGLLPTEDHREAMAAFKERRDPVFKGR